METRDTITAQLTADIQKLERLTQAVIEQAHPQHKPSPPSLMDIIYRWGQWFFSKQTQKPAAASTTELPQLIDKITQYFFIISEFQKGNSEQQTCAHRFIQSIKNYNVAIDQINSNVKHTSPAKVSPNTSKPSFSAVACLKRKIEWPTVISGSHLKVHDAFRSQLPTPCTLDGKELDLFRVKAITMLRKWGLNIQEAIEAANNAPVAVWQESSDCFNAIQTLSPIPGEKIILTALFQRVSAHGSSSLPLHYQLFTLNTVTAFPSPSQYTSGWTLAAEMLPILTGRNTHASSWEVLYRQRQELAKSLLPQGSCYSSAKNLYILKKEAFQQQRSDLLQLHEELAAAILSATGIDTSQQQACQLFFAELNKSHRPFAALAETYQLFLDAYIVQPSWQLHGQTLETIANNKISLHHRLEQAKGTFQCAMLGFVLLLGSALTPTLVRLLPWLQGHAQALPLMPCDRLLVLSLYQQQQDFIHEMNSESIQLEDVKKSVVLYLQRDIALFQKGESFASTSARSALQELTCFSTTAAQKYS